MKEVRVGVAVITHFAKAHLSRCLPPLLHSPLNPRVLVVNSSSNDGTIELAQELGADALLIPRWEFNHGLTRERARKALGTEIIAMVTPDAYAKDVYVLEKLVTPLLNGEASLAYARQLPHSNADLWEAFPRRFNYGEKSHFRSIEDARNFGAYTFFFSDSFGAYLNSALDEIGGFKEVLTGEDTVACAELLKCGHKVAYVAEAEVHHSHSYSLKEEFKRHFDTGLARKMYGKLIALGGKDDKRGVEYVQALFGELCRENNYHLIPYAAIQSAVKWLGYKIGQSAENAPLRFKQLLSAQDFYWNSCSQYRR